MVDASPVAGANATGAGISPGRLAVRSPRDPEGRRRAILSAAIELIAQNGAGRVTHRTIAAKADVPLGATTYYFPTLDSLVGDALAMVAQRARDDLVQWASALRTTDDVAGTLAQLARRYVEDDREQALLDYELLLAAARRPELRGLAEAWGHGICEALAPFADERTARAISALLEGTMLAAVVSGRPVAVEVIEPALRQLLSADRRA